MTAHKSYDERQLTKPVDLCVSGGRLNREAVGWSRYPLHHCNLSGSPLRKKRWNYWAINTDRYLLSATLSNLDYLGLAFVYFIDFETDYFHELTVVRPFGRGCELGNYVDDDVIFEDARMNLAFKKRADGTVIQVECPNFRGENLSAELTAKKPPDHQTLNVVIPWNDRQFQFTSKQNTLPVEGSINIGTKNYEVEAGFACLDFGRGIWPFTSFWNWANVSGISNGHTIGLNFGAGWTDGTGMTENGICIDGVLSKISEDLVFKYDSSDFSVPWNISTELSDKVDVNFEPFFKREAKNKVLMIGSEMTQLFGNFSGTVKDEAGTAYQFEDLLGWVEQHHARW